LPPIATKLVRRNEVTLCADFVAEVRCKLFWSVIPSL